MNIFSKIQKLRSGWSFFLWIYFRHKKEDRENKGTETPGIQEKQDGNGNVIKSYTVYSNNGHTNHGINDGIYMYIHIETYKLIFR